MLLKIGFNNQPLNPFVQIKFSKFSSIDSTWDHFTFNSNLINPTITKRSPKLRITHDQRDTQIEYQQNLSIRLRKCKFSKQIKVSILPSPNQCISRLEKLDKQGKRERGQILAIISSLILLNMKNGIILPLEASSSNTLTRRR